MLSPPPSAWELATPLLRSASPRPGAQSFLSSSPLLSLSPVAPSPAASLYSGPRLRLPYLPLLP